MLFFVFHNILLEVYILNNFLEERCSKNIKFNRISNLIGGIGFLILKVICCLFFQKHVHIVDETNYKE